MGQYCGRRFQIRFCVTPQTINTLHTIITNITPKCIAHVLFTIKDRLVGIYACLNGTIHTETLDRLRIHTRIAAFDLLLLFFG